MVDTSRLSRPRLCARIFILTCALEAIEDVARLDGQPAGPAADALAAELLSLEWDLQTRDQAATADAAPARYGTRSNVNRVSRYDERSDAARAFSEALSVPADELAAMAPGMYREIMAERGDA